MWVGGCVFEKYMCMLIHLHNMVPVFFLVRVASRSRGYGVMSAPMESRVPRPPPVPPVPKLEPLFRTSDEDDLALVLDTGMASVKVSALKLELYVHVQDILHENNTFMVGPLIYMYI